jgi:hypothetical protein
MTPQELFMRFEQLVREFEEEYSYFYNPTLAAVAGEVEYRMQIVELLVPRIKQTHQDLCAVSASEEDKVKVQEVFERFHSRYRQLIGGMKQWLKNWEQSRFQEKFESTRIDDGHAAESSRKTKWKLPVLKLMEWDGAEETWPVFRDLFKESVYNDVELSTIVKYQYLLSYVKFPPSQPNVLQHFPHTAEYFEKAWEALVARYDDNRKQKADHFNKLFTTKRMNGESASELRNFIDSFESTVRVLMQLNATFEDVLLHVAQHRLDEQTRKDWLKEVDDDENPTWVDLKLFLTRRWRQLDASMSRKQSSKPNPMSKPNQQSKAKSFTSTNNNNSQNEGNQTRFACLMNDGNHMLYKCQRFLAYTPHQRFEFIKERSLCWLCFSPKHPTKQCKHQELLKCATCKGAHNILIHVGRVPAVSSSFAEASQNQQREFPLQQQTHFIENQPQMGQQTHANVYQPQQQVYQPQMSPTSSQMNAPQFSSQQQNSQSFQQPSTSFEIYGNRASGRQFNLIQKESNLARNAYFTHRQTLLPTVRLNIYDAHGIPHEIRALLDSGSDTNFLSTRMAKMLNVKFNDTRYEVIGINGSSSVIRHKVDVMIGSMYGSYEREIECSVMEVVTGIMPGKPLNKKLVLSNEYYHADPDFAKPAPVELLLNIDVFLETLLSGKIKLAEGPWMFHTMFGWAIGGSMYLDKPSSLLTSLSNFCNFDGSNENLQQQLERFMEIEHYGATKKTMSPEEKFCNDHFKANTIRDDSGRYIVKLPEKPNIAELSNNRSNSFRQYNANERRRQHDEEFNSLYVDYMEDFIETGHMSETEVNADGYYVPHHGVKRASSTTTKLRTVFNASSKSESGLSLNDCLYIGPTVQPESFDILMRFREKPFVLKCDIEKMYRQILIDEGQRKFQKVLWRSTLNEAIKHYVINTIMFGVAPAPWLATRTLVQIAEDYGDCFPEVAKVIKNSFYVDDGMFGCDSIEEGIKLRDQLRHVLLEAGMPTRKWISNEKSLYDRLPIKDVETIEDDTTTIKALGMTWNPVVDTMACCTKKSRADIITKTSVLSEIASLHDPLGIVGPVVLAGKLFMKQLVILKLDWKEEAPPKFKGSWKKFTKNIDAINNVFVNRHVIIKNAVRIELHGFSDASEDAYGAAIYIRSMDKNGKLEVCLICSKSRISPLKKKSIARLELCGALLLAKLIARILSILSVNVDQVILWCDSMITLFWIRTSSHRLGTFVGNRVAIIQELTEKFIWRHIPGEMNPADLVSRGLLPEEIRDCELWWKGPNFLSQPVEEWPETLITVSEDDPEFVQELRKTCSTAKQETSENSLYKEIEFEAVDYDDLISTFAYMLRFFTNAKEKNGSQLEIGKLDKLEALRMDEMEAARIQIVKIIQRESYPAERKFFERLLENPAVKEDFPAKSSLKHLAPFMDKENKIIRVGGRIEASPVLTESQKHQIVLPKGNFAKLIAKNLHVKHLHAGVSATMSFVREDYWPKDVRRIVQQVIRSCIICFKAKPELATQFMSSLPENRLKMTHAFLRAATDYGGPFSLRSSLTARASIVKVWIAMFKCMCTGAIHIEAVTSLSTEGFIMAFDRFVSRRGLSIEIYSDNGTNFVGSNNEFKRILAESEAAIGEHLNQQGIKWHFTTPVAPHAGGYYEAGIKSIKHHMTRVMTGKSFDYEQFSTILTKIEAVVNSRPLTPMSEDPSDLTVLTPGHFLIGRPLIAKPERNLMNANENRLDRYNRLQQIQQRFWDGFYHDHLHHLQTRPKGFREKQDFSIGALVLLKDDNLPTMKWVTGRIIHIYPTKDGITRRVKVHTSKGDKDRDVRYLCLLPMESAAARENVSE